MEEKEKNLNSELAEDEEKEKEEKEEQEIGSDYLEELLALIRTENNREVLKEKLSDYHENDIAETYEFLTYDERKKLYEAVGAEQFSEIFAYVDDAEEYIEEMNPVTAAKVLAHMDSDDAVDILDEMDDEKENQLLKLMDEETTADIALLRSYDEDEIGSKMTTNFVYIPNTFSIKEAMKSLVEQAGENDNITTIYVLDGDNHFYGAIALKDLIIARQGDTLESITSTSYPYVNDHAQIADCLEKIKTYTEDSLPVLNEEGNLLGVITAQDIVEVVDDEMGDDYAKLAGLTEEDDLQESIFHSIKKRIPWLLILLVLAMGVSAVVGLFEPVISSLAVLVCFQSVVLSMSGNTGTQSLAVTIRAISDKERSVKELFALGFKELRVSLCNGLILGTLATIASGLYVYFVVADGYTFAQSIGIGACVGIALALATVISGTIGCLSPILFSKIGIDPAVASGPLITTLNDLNAVVIYYGAAWVLLIKVMGLGG